MKKEIFWKNWKIVLFFMIFNILIPSKQIFSTDSETRVKVIGENPMDNALHDSGTDFNLRSYGQADHLLHAGVPVKRVSIQEKPKAGIGFSTPARLTGTTSSALGDFSSGTVGSMILNCNPDEYNLTYSGYADVVVAQNSVTNPASALGQPLLVPNSNSYYARLDNDGDYLILDLTDVIPVGSTISIYWGSDDGNLAGLNVMGTLNGTDYVNGTDFYDLQTWTSTKDLDNANPQQDIVTFNVVTDGVRYLRFARVTGQGRPGINGIYYSVDICLSAYPIALDDAIDMDDDASINIDVQANDSDPQNLPLTTSIVSGPNFGTATVQPNGTVTYVPNSSFPGTDAFTYQVCNTYGSGLCDNATVTISGCTVEEFYGVFDAGYADAVIAQNSTANPEAALNEPLLVSSSNSYYALMDNATDYLVLDLTDIIPSGSTISIYIGSDDGNTAEVQVAGTLNSTDYIGGTGFFDTQSFTTSSDLNDANPIQDVVTYYVSNATRYLRFNRILGKPGVNGVFYELYTCQSAYPSSEADEVETDLNTLVNINVQANDSDPQGLTLTTSLVTSPQHGTATVLPNGTINYTPNTGYTGLETFDYRVCNNFGTGLCDTATVTIHIGNADLALSKTTDAGMPYEGDSYTYTLTVTNHGPDQATNITIVDFFPGSLSQDGFSATQGSYVNKIWTVGNLDNGETATLILYVTVLQGGVIENSAAVLHLDQADNNTANNSASVTVHAYKSFAAGACIIDLSSTASYNAGLKPYGLVYDLVKNYQIPVYWAINPNKSFASETNKVDQPDFTINGITYYSGAFIIEDFYVTVVQSVIDSWVSSNPGLIVRCNQPAFTVPIHGVMTSLPRAVLDFQNGDKAEDAFFIRAGILYNTNLPPEENPYYYATPAQLNACDDIYIMPHADPHQWDQATKEAFADFINQGGWLFAACHSPSSLEFYFDLNNDGNSDMNLLSNVSLIEWGDHSNGTPPYNYAVTSGHYYDDLASDPFMQFRGTIDGALQNGSEQIFIPDANGWRSSTTIAVYDPDHPQAPGSYPAGVAAAVVYGPAFGDPELGMVLYEASHTFAGGNIQQNIGAARILGNFWFQAGLTSKPKILVEETPPDTLLVNGNYTFSVIGTAKTPPVTYAWSSSCGGTFTNPTGSITQFIPPVVITDTDCSIIVNVYDACGATNFESFMTVIHAKSDMELLKTGTFVDENANGYAEAGETIMYSFTVVNTGLTTLTNITIDDPKVTVNGGPISSLAPGASDNMTFTASYILTQADIDAGQVINQATVTGTIPGGGTVNDTSDDPNDPTDIDPDMDGDPDDPTVVPLNQRPSIAVTKTANPTTYNAVGNVISYEITLENNGNVTVYNPTMTDPDADAAPAYVSGDMDGDGVLDVGEVWVFAAQYTVTQQDIDAGSFTNTATGNGLADTNGNGTGDTPVTDDDDAIAIATQNPGIQIVKTSTTVPNRYSYVGDILTYDLVVTNTGNVTLTNVVVSDPKAVVTGSPIASIAPGASNTLTASYVVTLADLNNGQFVNTATATGDYSDANGNPQTVSDDDIETIIAVIPDVTPVITAIPNVMQGLTDFNLTVRVTELNNINTNGLIIVKIPKESRLTFKNPYNPALTILGSVPLNNANWAFSQDATHYIFSSTTVIPAGGFSTFGFVAQFDPANTKGIYTLTSQIISGSGGEIRINNNVDSEKLDYFIE